MICNLWILFECTCTMIHICNANFTVSKQRQNTCDNPRAWTNLFTHCRCSTRTSQSLPWKHSVKIQSWICVIAKLQYEPDSLQQNEKQIKIQESREESTSKKLLLQYFKNAPALKVLIIVRKMQFFFFTYMKPT